MAKEALERDIVTRGNGVTSANGLLTRAPTRLSCRARCRFSDATTHGVMQRRCVLQARSIVALIFVRSLQACKRPAGEPCQGHSNLSGSGDPAPHNVLRLCGGAVSSV